MRRLTTHRKVKRLGWLRRRERRRLIRRLRRNSGLKGRERRIATIKAVRTRVNPALFLRNAREEQALVPSTWVMADGKVRRCLRLKAPADMKYGTNATGVLSFLFEIRRQVFIARRFESLGSRRRPGLYIDLDTVKEIDLEGALLLAAEVDRIRLLFGFKPRMDDANWDPIVRAFLFKCGFYSVTEARGSREPMRIELVDEVLREEGLVVLPFVSGAEVESRKAQQLRDGLFEACEPGNAARRPLYDGLVEAFTNAVQHAYDPTLLGDGLPRVGRWWASAVVQVTHRQMYLVVYDQGVGIPATLSNQPFWEPLRATMRRDSDAARIVAALEYGESSTKSAGRGNGLFQMCQLTKAFEDASVCFTSLTGQVTYAAGRVAERVQLKTRFGGTMIRWSATVATRGE